MLGSLCIWEVSDLSRRQRATREAVGSRGSGSHAFGHTFSKGERPGRAAPNGLGTEDASDSQQRSQAYSFQGLQQAFDQ